MCHGQAISSVLEETFILGNSTDKGRQTRGGADTEGTIRLSDSASMSQ